MSKPTMEQMLDAYYSAVIADNAQRMTLAHRAILARFAELESERDCYRAAMMRASASLFAATRDGRSITSMVQYEQIVGALHDINAAIAQRAGGDGPVTIK